jgi:hypothetical protein
VEAKGDANGWVCGPGNTKFSSSTVSAQDNKLKLEYKQVNGVWMGSEVRVVLPDDKMPYLYGTYKFDIESVTVKNGAGETISNMLDPDLVLGLFTWDSTESYETHENWNHEVDIEISRWGNATNTDAQFLIQPWVKGDHYHRFSTGGEQGGHSYEFTWSPNSMEWYTDTNGGVSHTYTTKQANEANLPDYIQCLPADVEVRINLWNNMGTVAPQEMDDDHVAEVIISEFTYTPGAVQAVPIDGDCSKTCQCEESLTCIESKCTAA